MSMSECGGEFVLRFRLINKVLDIKPSGNSGLPSGRGGNPGLEARSRLVGPWLDRSTMHCSRQSVWKTDAYTGRNPGIALCSNMLAYVLWRAVNIP
jgi:hypothetical protein